MGHRMDSKFRPSGHFARAKSTVLRKPTTSARSKFLSAQPRRYVNPYPSKTIILHTERKLERLIVYLKSFLHILNNRKVTWFYLKREQFFFRTSSQWLKIPQKSLTRSISRWIIFIFLDQSLNNQPLFLAWKPNETFLNIFNHGEF